MLGERLTTLLSLISQDEYKTVDEFAQKMSLSTKTVRGLLQELNEQLQTHGAEVLHERGKGYRLKVQDLDKFQTIFLKADSNIPQDSRGRVRFLIEYFLKDDCYTKVETLCEKLYVSRKTLTSDLRQAEDFFNRFQLTLERKPHYGMRLVGDEFHKRQCLSEYLQERNPGMEHTALEENAQEYELAQMLVELLEQENYHITDVGLNSLVVHVAVAIQRIQSGQYIQMTEDTFVSVAVLKAPIQWDEQHEVQAIFLVSVSRQKNKKLQDFYATTARLLLDEQRIGQLIQKRSYQTLAECLEAVDNERTE